MVHLLPYERYDLYREAVRRITAMASCLKDHNLCNHFKNACHSNANLPVSEDTIHNEEVAVDDLLGADDDSLRVPDHDWQAVQVIEEPEYELLQCESGAVKGGLAVSGHRGGGKTGS